MNGAVIPLRFQHHHVRNYVVELNAGKKTVNIIKLEEWTGIRRYCPVA